MNNSLFTNSQNSPILFFLILLQKQSDKDDEANDTNDFCELVNSEL